MRKETIEEIRRIGGKNTLEFHFNVLFVTSLPSSGERGYYIATLIQAC